MVREICGRWQKTRMLGELYKNVRIFAEFERFLEDLKAESAASDEKMTNRVKPGFNGVNYLGPTPERTLPEVCDDFTARFHRSLCLHSIGVSSRRIANSIQVAGEEECDMLEKACQAWIKVDFTIGGRPSGPKFEERVDIVETWDFIYNFLLRKLFPLITMSKWMRACKSHHMLHSYHCMADPFSTPTMVPAP